MTTQGEKLLMIYNYMIGNNLIKDKKDFSKHFDIDYSNLNKYFSDNRKFYSNDSFLKKLKELKISINWFIYGEGEMIEKGTGNFNNNIISNNNGIIGNNNNGNIKIDGIINTDNNNIDQKRADIYEEDIYNILTTNGKNIQNKVAIPILDVKASAGYGTVGADHPNIVDYLVISKNILKSHNAKNVVCIEIKGDSMLPVFLSGDYILCDESDKTIDNGFFIINRSGEIYFKRLLLLKDKIVIKSLNPEYPPYEISLEEEKEHFSIIARVFKHISLKDL